MKQVIGADRERSCPPDSPAKPAHDVDTQRLRILRCTANALANTLGGLRFKAGTRPWLDQLSLIGASAVVAGTGCAAGPRIAID